MQTFLFPLVFEKALFQLNCEIAFLIMSIFALDSAKFLEVWWSVKNL